MPDLLHITQKIRMASHILKEGNVRNMLTFTDHLAAANTTWPMRSIATATNLRRT